MRALDADNGRRSGRRDANRRGGVPLSSVGRWCRGRRSLAHGTLPTFCRSKAFIPSSDTKISCPSPVIPKETLHALAGARTRPFFKSNHHCAFFILKANVNADKSPKIIRPLGCGTTTVRSVPSCPFKLNLWGMPSKSVTTASRPSR